MKDGTRVRGYLAKATAALTVLCLLPVALIGPVPSQAPALHPLSMHVQAASGLEYSPQAAGLFASFSYDRGQVLGTYVQFAYDPVNGTMRSILGLAGDMPVLFVGSLAIEGFAPARGQEAVGSTFEAQGYLVAITAHDDPTVLVEIRTNLARTVAIELPATATNVSLLAATGSWPAATVSYTVGEEQGRFLLGSGSFSVSGTRLVAKMADTDLLVFKSVPPLSANRDEWRRVLDAITAGHVVAELALVATSDGRWAQNTVRYRIGVAAWPLAVVPGKASIQVDSLLPGGAVVLLAFDSTTMPFNAPKQLSVRANGFEVNRTDNSLMLLFSSETAGGAARYSVLSLPGTVVALYLPSLAAISIEVLSVPPNAPAAPFEPGSDIAMIAALAIVSAAAARMLRRRED
ncbi:MAG: hypothetical protein ACREDF_07975 [Thermoplasmata archaeon]